MVIIPGKQSFVHDGAIVPSIKELKTTIHALIEERNRVVRGHGDHYGEMTILELDVYIAQLQQYAKERGV